MATAVGTGPMDDPSAVSWKQRSECPNCGKALVRNPHPQVEQMAEWRIDPTRTPLVQFGGTAIMRSTDVPPGTPRLFHTTGGAATYPADLGTLSAVGSASASLTLTTPNQPTPIPSAASAPIKQGGWVRKTEFEAAMMTAGGFVGGVIGDGKTAAIGLGGAIGWAWARRSWNKRGGD